MGTLFRLIGAFVAAVLAIGVTAAMLVLLLDSPGAVPGERWIGAWLAGKLAIEVAAVVALVFGVPAYAILRMIDKTSWRIYLAAGMVLGGLVTLSIAVGLNGLVSLAIAGLALLFGIVGSLTFWLVARPDRARGRRS
jgi:hypothetical protein